MADTQPKATKHDEAYCRSCGKVIKKEAEICPNCGVRNMPAPNNLTVEPKKKSVAVLLAIFLGLWTWLYTYKKDSGKFWGNFIGCLFTFGLWGLVAWIWAIIDVATKSDEFYEKYPTV